jgi:DNA polymerase-3 subunit epsilon
MNHKIMCFDTETTGLPVFDRKSDHPSQPHLVEYTAMLVDGETRQELAFEAMLIQPQGWRITQEMTDIHGISDEEARKRGVPERIAVQTHIAMLKKADLVIGYNVAFDLRIMRIAMLRCGVSRETLDQIAASTKRHCVMQQATPACRIPPTDKMMAAGFKKWKSPNLTEATKAIFGEDLEGAHDSRIDTLATLRLYWHLSRDLLSDRDYRHPQSA